VPLSLVIYKRGNNHTLVFLRLFERARPRIFFCKNSQQIRRGGGFERFWAIAFIFFSSSPSRAKLLPQERKRIKISSLFSKKIQFNFSFVLHKNHSRKTQWLVRNKPLVNPPVRSFSRSFKCIQILFSSLLLLLKLSRSSSSFSLLSTVVVSRHEMMMTRNHQIHQRSHL